MSPFVPMKAMHLQRVVLIFIVFGLISSNCYPAQDVKPNLKVDADWYEVLKLATSKEKESRAMLEKFAKQGSEKPSSTLAQIILSKWDDRANTFYSSNPMTVFQPKVSLDEIRKILPGKNQKSRLFTFTISIDANGFVTKAVLNNPSDNSKLNELMLRSMYESLFCPAKPEDDFAPSTMQYRMTIEVR